MPEATGERRVAYVTKRLPTITETFVFREVLELEARGWDVRLHALARSHDPPGFHREAADLAARCRYPTVGSLIRAQLWWARRQPQAFWGAWRFAWRGRGSTIRARLRSLATVPVAAAFAREIEAAGITHTHAHWATEPALAANVIARLTGGTYSFTAHAYDLQVDRRLLRAKAADASFVVAISDLNRSVIERTLGGARAKIAVVHCGVDREAFPPRATGPDGTPFVIVNVGALRAYKGQRHLLRAAAILRAEGDDIVVRLVGAGPERAALAREAEALNMAGRVEFLGPLAGDPLRGALRDAHVFAMPSVQLASGLTEGIPVALMEAMATGVPVVASRVSGVPELVDDEVSGLLVPPGDDRALAAALRRLLRDPALAARLATAGVQTVADGFDQHRTVQQLETLLLEAVRAPR